MPINAAWHQQHRMPKNATPAQRAQWHVEHAEACGCRPVPKSVAAAVKQLRAKR